MISSSAQDDDAAALRVGVHLHLSNIHVRLARILVTADDPRVSDDDNQSVVFRCTVAGKLLML